MTQPDDIKPEYDRRLVNQYREAANEMPSPALDRRILDQARAAASEPNARKEPTFGARPVPGAGPASRFAADVNDAPRQRREEQRWLRPLALAATVVLGIGIVVRVQMERPDMTPPEASEAKVAQAPAPAEAPAQPKADAAAPAVAPAAPAAAPAAAPPAVAESAAPAHPKVAADVAPQAREKKAIAPAAQAPARSRVDSNIREELAKEEAEAKMRQSAASELQKMEAPRAQSSTLASGGASNPASADRAANVLASRAPSVAAEPAKPAVPAAPAPVASAAATATPAAPAIAAAPAAPPPPPAIAPAPAPAGTLGDARARTAPFYEGDPDLWSRHIVELRRAGRAAAADADLKRMRARFPDYKLPPEALPPP